MKSVVSDAPRGVNGGGVSRTARVLFDYAIILRKRRDVGDKKMRGANAADGGTVEQTAASIERAQCLPAHLTGFDHCSSLKAKIR